MGCLQRTIMDEKDEEQKDLCNLTSQLLKTFYMKAEGKNVDNMLISLQDQLDAFADESWAEDMKEDMKGR